MMMHIFELAGAFKVGAVHGDTALVIDELGDGGERGEGGQGY